MSTPSRSYAVRDAGSPSRLGKIWGWMAYYGRFRHSELHLLLARINWHVQEWIRRKYRRLRPYKAMKRAWNRITVQKPGLLPH